MAASKPASKSKSPKARPGRSVPKQRLPHEVPRYGIVFDPDDNLTHQSFRDECDINRIVDTYARTGLVTSQNRREPQYGDAPESNLFEAACAQAAIRSAEAEGFEYPEIDDEAPSEAPESTNSENAGESPAEAENASQAATPDERGQPTL